MDRDEFPTALSLFKAIYRNFNIYAEHCPRCNAKGFIGFHDEYAHNLVDYFNNFLHQGVQVDISRLFCSSCGKTFSVLPDIFVPYKSYSILFILKVLKAYYHRTESVAALCQRYEIAVSTLYAWKKRYNIHKTLYLGKLAKYFYKKDPHLTTEPNICFTSFLCDFFNQFGFSFLQFSKAAESFP